MKSHTNFNEFQLQKFTAKIERTQNTDPIILDTFSLSNYNHLKKICVGRGLEILEWLFVIRSLQFVI